MKRHIVVVIGTRPGIVKMAPVFHAAASNSDIDVSLLYTGQHYSSNMKDAIWEAFDLPEPDKVITGIEDCSSHAEQISKMMIGSEAYFKQSNADTVLVCGDANTNFAAGVAARKLGLKLGHVESGLRSRDWSMPEEHNRVMLDHISDYCFAPTEWAAENIRREHVMGQIIVTGNTVVDALRYAEKNNKFVKPENKCFDSPFTLFTFHRQENVDIRERLEELLKAILSVSEVLPAIFTVHPRTKKMISQFGLDEMIANKPNIYLVEPLPYREMIWALKNARVVLTDSGGLQEETCILGTPCVTMRDNTERPEAVDVGANIVAGVDSDSIKNAFRQQFEKSENQVTWINPFGDGEAGFKILETIL